jgi:cytoskeletal protein CcmA (bactofilin family)
MSFFSSGRREKPLGDSLPSTSVSDSPKPVVKRQIEFETVIGRSTTFSGELRCQADVLINGTFEGTLEIEGNISVGDSGRVYADIHARNVAVAGRVRGNISGKKVQLYRTAHVWGNISASAITTEEGAFIDGKLMIHEVAPESSSPGLLPDPSLLEGEIQTP